MRTEAATIPDTLLPRQQAEGPADARTDFLKLLIAQLSHQDPLKPQDGTEFIQQLATLTQVEQTQAGNSKLDQLILGQAGSARASYVGLVGHVVEAKTNNVTIPTDADTALTAKFPGDAKDITVTITDATGKVVRTRKLDSHASGELPIEINANGETPLANGNYTIEVKATIAGNTDTAVPTAIRGRVTELELSNGTLRFLIGKTAVSTADITSVAT